LCGILECADALEFAQGCDLGVVQKLVHGVLDPFRMYGAIMVREQFVEVS
jgi:hypothetical protein